LLIHIIFVHGHSLLFLQSEKSRKYGRVSRFSYPDHIFFDYVLSTTLSRKARYFYPLPLQTVGLDSALVDRAYLESVLVDTALVLPLGRVMCALSLLRLSSLAPCQPLSFESCGAHRAVLPWHFPLRRTEASKPGRPIAAVREIPSTLRSARKCEEKHISRRVEDRSFRAMGKPVGRRRTACDLGAAEKNVKR